VPSRIAELKKAPSYKQLCICILKNDFILKYLGYEPKKSKYYHLLKRIEIESRDINKPKQLKLF